MLNCYMEKTIMVTGATAGFGRAIAAKFAAGGYKVIITGRRNERLLELQKELSDSGAKVLTLNFDVRTLIRLNRLSIVFPPDGKTSTFWLTTPDWLSGFRV